MKNILPVLLVLIALLLTGCSVGNNTEEGYTNLSVSQLNQMLENKKFTMVNVHIPFEGDLPQTDLSIPYNEIDQHLDQLPGKDDPIVLYCRSDRMSHIAAATLVENGYTNVYNVEGGFDAWKAAGFPMAGE